MTEFNYGYAAEVYDIISKMDADTASVFSQFVCYDVLMNDIAANQRTLDSLTGRIVKSIRDEVSKKLLTDDSSESIASAALVGTVTKKWDDDPNTKYWDARDAGGRFSSSGGAPRPSAPGTKTSVTFSREKVKAGDKKRRHLHANTSPHGADFNLTSAIASAGKHGGEFSDQWDKASNTGSNNASTYARIQAGSQLLGVLPGTPPMKAAAGVGEFVGQYGPQAEKVVGPSIRSTVYRYRGTERKLDPSLVKLQRGSVKAVAHNEGLEPYEVTPGMRKKATTSAAVQYFLGGNTIDGEKIKGHIPSKGLSELQASSGRLPPSEGVIISQNGKIVTQATGYMEDHYLPFNLKNLKGLKGGSYVRTRSSGGLTTEDIYTGLVGGAESVTVVSRSGVFTVNFDEDFKGGRRYNDKARRMVGQYGKTLDAIKSEQVSRRGLSIDERLQIRDDVELELGSWASQAEIKSRIMEKEREFKSTPDITRTELAEIDTKAKDAYPENARQQKITRMKLIDAKMEEKAANKYRLDGEGYATALQAMQEQFPYYIDSTSFHFHDPKNPTVATEGFSTEKDSGYVKPKFNRPEGVSEGYFDPTVTGHSKISADKTNYQNHANRRVKEEPVKEEQAGARVTPKVAPQEQVRANIAHAAAQNDSDKALRAMVNYAAVKLHAEDYPVLTSVSNNTVKLSDVMADPGSRSRFEDELVSAKSSITEGGTEEDKAKYKVLTDAYNIAHKQVGGKEFDPGSYRFGDSPETPFQYANDGPAYKIGSQGADYQREWARQEQRSGLQGKFGDKSDDADLQKAATFAGTVVQAAKSAQSGDGSKTDLYTALAASAPDINTATAIAGRLGSPSQAKVIEREYSVKVDAIERMRRIKAAQGGNDFTMDDNFGSELKSLLNEPASTGPKAPVFSTVPGQVISNVPQQMDKAGLLDMARQAAKSYDDRGERSKADIYHSIFQSIKSEDEVEDILESVDELPESEASLWKSSLKQAGYRV